MFRLVAAAATALSFTPALAQETIVTHAYVNFGEPAYGPDAAHLDYVNPDAPKGGEISQWSQSTFDGFNAYTRQGVSAPGFTDLIFEGILKATADDPYAAYCYLCTTMEYPADRSTVTFNLRDDVTFSDGTPLTAEDVKFTFELGLEQGIAEYRNVVSTFVSEVEVLSPTQVRYTFTDDAPVNDRVTFVGGLTVLSKTHFEENGLRLDETQERPFLGTGPYVVGDVDFGRRVVYERDPDWWGADHWLNVGRWNFEAIRYEVFADSNAAFEGFKGGVYTAREENTSRLWATGYDIPAVERGWIVREELPDGAIKAAQGYVFNLKRETWQDARVRDAIAMMMNFEWSNETLFYGLYERPTSFWQDSDLQATGTPSEAELALLEPLVADGLLDASILTNEARQPFENDADSTTPGRRMLRAASRLLDEAGWETGEDGLRRKDGRTLSLEIMTFSALFDRVVNPYVENLRRIGVDASLRRVDVSQYVQRRRDGDWDMTTHQPTQGYEPSLVTLKQWFHSDTAEDSSRNVMALADPGIDALVDNFRTIEGLEDLTAKANALDRALRAHGFWIPQWYNPTDWVAYWDIYDRPEELPPLSVGLLDFWWYDAERHDELRAEGAPI
ncbi:extracellular solute-binding protein [Jannaschia sp. LMIT008]|uniref:extracellular solute-binding protein n=1 Tax=Jannaschia maritima TaxID=3032585 RepID=UPI002811D44B|nr:extracellular solute-binding protein [Jannaschia sp. LMIT008]